MKMNMTVMRGWCARLDCKWLLERFDISEVMEAAREHEASNPGHYCEGTYYTTFAPDVPYTEIG